MARINESLSGAERKAALCQLLDQETQLIASIGRHKIDANTETKRRTIQYFLDKVCNYLGITLNKLSLKLLYYELLYIVLKYLVVSYILICML